MQQYFPAVNVARYANARAESRFAGDKFIMIEAQPGTDVPVSLVKIILNVEGGLDIPLVLGECKLYCGARFELRRVSDLIGERFVYWCEERVHSRLPIVMSGMTRNVGARVTFAVAAILRNDNGSGQFVGNGVTSFAVRNRESQAIAFRKIMLIRGGKSITVSPVGKVLQNWGIEVPVAMKSAAAEFQMILARSVANFRRAAQRIEAAAPDLDSAMPSLGRIFFGR